MAQFISRITTAAALTVAAITTTTAWAQTMTVEQARKQVAPFYEMLNQPATKDIKALSEQALSPDWKSYSSETDFKGRDAFVAQVGGFGKLIPDLRWDCSRRLNSDPPCRSNIDPGRTVAFVTSNCG